MATIGTIPIQPAVERLLNAADLDAFPDRLPSGPVSYELHHGRLFIMNPPAAEHGKLQSFIARKIGVKADDCGLGMTFTEVGLILWRDPDHVFGADVAFIQASKLPERTSKEGFLETIPDFVAEIRSKNNTWPEMESKAADYLKAGVGVVWIVNPQKRCVVVYRQGQEPVTHSSGDLTLAELVPDFRLSVEEILAVWFGTQQH